LLYRCSGANGAAQPTLEATTTEVPLVAELAGNYLSTALSLAFEDTLRLFDSPVLRGRVMDVQESQPAQTPHAQLVTKTH
jgi:hypothetical protein